MVAVGEVGCVQARGAPSPAVAHLASSACSTSSQLLLTCYTVYLYIPTAATKSTNHPSIHIYPSIHPSIHTSNHSLIHNIYLFSHPSILGSIGPTTQPSIHSSIHPPNTHPRIHSFTHSYIYLIIHPSIHPYPYSFIHTSIQLSIYPSIHPNHPFIVHLFIYYPQTQIPIHSFIHPSFYIPSASDPYKLHITIVNTWVRCRGGYCWTARPQP